MISETTHIEQVSFSWSNKYFGELVLKLYSIIAAKHSIPIPIFFFFAPPKLVADLRNNKSIDGNNIINRKNNLIKKRDKKFEDRKKLF